MIRENGFYRQQYIACNLQVNVLYLTGTEKGNEKMLIA